MKCKIATKKTISERFWFQPNRRCSALSTQRGFGSLDVALRRRVYEGSARREPANAACDSHVRGVSVIPMF
eukprot:2835069-Pleurochrysis_carterae.AAC.1